MRTLRDARGVLALAAFWAVGFPGLGPAQTITGEITGTVTDQSGGIVAGAALELIREGLGAARAGVTNQSGTFVFAMLPPGTYTLKVNSAGFRNFEQSGIVLTANERVSVGQIQLSVGAAAEIVTVSADTSQISTESVQTSARLTPLQLDRTVVRGRDVMNMVKLLPGVSQGAIRDGAPAGETDTGLGNDLGGLYGTFTPNISGTRSYWNTVTLDGQMGSDAHLVSLFNEVTSVDAIGEVNVVLTNYNAEFGRNSGPQINMVSKSGSSEFHGSLYWYKRHEQFNANGFFNNRDGLPKPPFRYDTLGGTIGGPIYIPGKWNVSKSKAFFFYSREDWRVKEPLNIGRLTTPTALERQGDFSQTLDQNNRLIIIRDPVTGSAFPGNVIPQSRISRNGQALLNVFPMPNVTDRSVTGGAYNYQFQEIRDKPKNTNLLKLDFMPAPKDTITIRGRNYWSDGRSSAGMAAVNSNWPQFRHHYLFTEDSVKVGWTRVIGPSTVNEFSIGFRDLGERGHGGYQSPAGFEPLIRSANGMTLGQFNPEVNPSNFIPAASFGGVPNPVNIAFDARIPIDAGDQRLDIVNNFSWIRGSHSLKFGVYYERNWVSEGPRANNLSGNFDFARDPNNPLDTNWAFSNALTGNFRSYVEPTLRVRGWGVGDLLEWFAQDTWKATRRLTINAGLRFSRYSPWLLREPEREGSILLLDRYDPARAPLFYRPARDGSGVRVAQNPATGEFAPAVFIGAFVPGTGDPSNGMVLANDPSVPAGFVEQEAIQIAPRIGFALDLFGNGKTAVRAGFGITKQAMLSDEIMNQVTQQPPRSFSPNIFYNNMETFLGAQGVLFPSSVYANQVNPVTPGVYNYSFGIQQELGFNTVLDVSYVGNVGRHLVQRRNLNVVPYGARFQSSNADPTNPTIALPDNFFRPFPGYNNLTYQEYSGTSNYNGLHVYVNRQFSRGLQFGLAYTWAKSMGLTDSDQQTLPTYQDYRIWNYGKLSFDQTHKLVGNYLWDLPKLSTVVPNAFVRAVFDNWQFNGIATFSSGTPSGIGFTTTDNADITGGGDGARVVMLQNPILGRDERSFDRWFNTNAFGRPAAGTFGNAPKDVFRRPGIHNWDLIFLKRIPLGRSEHQSLQFRCEMYNAFNHTQYFGLDTTARFDTAGNQVNPLFGQVTSTRLSRIMQLALHFYF
jgi:Carboxypeptidase regulatory-like domain